MLAFKTFLNESKGFFSKSRSNKSMGKSLLRIVAPDIKDAMKGIKHKLNHDSSGNKIIVNVHHSHVEKTKELLHHGKPLKLPNMVQVVGSK